LRFGIQGGRTTTFHNPVALQTDSVISVGAVNSIGVIDQAVTGPGGLTKQGDGKLTITNALSGWGGDTTILSGPTTGISTLSLSNPILADGRDLYTSATRTALDLNFAATDTIRSLFLDGTPQPVGLYGAIGSPATDTEVAWITGTGELNVTTLPVVGLPGDFNSDGKVDAGDYGTWRKNETANAALPNDNGLTTQSDRFNLWRANFGNPPGSGSGLGATAIPEPATFVLLMLIAPFFAGRNFGRTR
jgi:autotransporter-associated beta strand protein